jgi:hypothetical protein
MNKKLKKAARTKHTKNVIIYSNEEKGDENNCSLLALTREDIITYIAINISEGLATAKYSRATQQWTTTSAFASYCEGLEADDDFEALQKYPLPISLKRQLANK